MYLLSRNDPLRAIWVAAYFFNKLKRSQITHFDISASADKILQVEFDVVPYRVLAYLLLGVVRVFSKKVEYLFNDCNKVLLEIKDFVVTNKDSTQLETLSEPYFSITVPERFELDAFDLDILEDTCGGHHVLPREDITIKESMPKIGATILNTSDEHLCEELGTCDICSAPQNKNEDALSSHKSRFNVRVGTSPSLSSLEASKEKHLGLDEMHEELSMQELWGQSVCEEALLNLQMFTEFGQKEKNPVKLSCEHHQTSADMTGTADEAQLSGEDHQMLEEVCNQTNPLTVATDSTPRSKFRDASGFSTLEFLGIPTPVGKEAPRVSRKRKRLFDAVIVFPKEVLKQCIEDSSDLVRRHRKVPRTALAAWRARQVSNLPRCFLEPLISYTSSELSSLFGKKKLKIRASVRIENLLGKSVSRYPTASCSVEDVEKLGKSKACNDCESGESMNSEGGLNGPSFQAVDSPANIDIVRSPAGTSLEQTVIAPETPVQRTKSLRSFERPEISNLNRVGLQSGTAEKELSPEDQDFDPSFLNEDKDSLEGDNQDQRNVLSSRTRVVMRYLNRCFLNRRKQREAEVVNLMLLLQGKTKKGSAMLFYEILLLKSKGYVDVKQETAYDEILVLKSSRWEQSLTR